VQVLFYSQGILGLGFVEINIKCVGIEMKEKKCVLDLNDLGLRLYFLIFGHLIKKEFRFT